MNGSVSASEKCALEYAPGVLGPAERNRSASSLTIYVCSTRGKMQGDRDLTIDCVARTLNQPNKQTTTYPSIRWNER